jgi:hypothetical protein
VSSSCSRRWPRPPSRPSGWSTVCPFTCLPTTGCGGMPRSGTSPSSGRRPASCPDEFKARFPEVPWQQPARRRNRIVHGYWSVDLDVLHTTAQSRLPGFAAEVRRVLAF